MTKQQAEAFHAELTKLPHSDRAAALEAHTMKELRAYAKSRGLKGYSTKREPELIAFIMEHLDSAELEEPTEPEPTPAPAPKPAPKPRQAKSKGTPIAVKVIDRTNRRIEGNRTVRLLRGDVFRGHMARVLHEEHPDAVEVIEWDE